MDFLKKLLYTSGALSLYHRARNARTLTVIMFHRVLATSDPRWNHCDPDYTLRAEIFDDCLRFFAAHYTPVSADEVLHARREQRPLPPRALLLTFDDGWADNLEFALPRMRALGMPGLMFVVADAVGRAAPFYQERIVSAWRRGRLSASALAQALRRHAAETPVPPADDLATMRSLIAHVEQLPAAARDELLAALDSALDDGLRHMVSDDELHRLEAGGIAIGLHGKTHTPLTEAADLDAELAGARAAVAARLRPAAPPLTMSFPHGRYNGAIAQRARDAGYELVFTSVPVVNATSSTVGWLLGRLGFESHTIVDAEGRFRPERLALYLFRQPQRRLA